MQLTTFGRHIATSPSFKIKASDSEDVKTAKSEVRSFLGTLEGKGFGRCEWQKVIAFLHSESDMHLRGQRGENIVSKRWPFFAKKPNKSSMLILFICMQNLF